MVGFVQLQHNGKKTKKTSEKSVKAVQWLGASMVGRICGKGRF